MFSQKTMQLNDSKTTGNGKTKRVTDIFNANMPTHMRE